MLYSHDPLSLRTLAVAALFVATILVTFTGSRGIAVGQDDEPQFTTEFRFEDCKFKSQGANPYFILKPGYRLVLKGEEDGNTVRLMITVLHETERIVMPDLGVVRTRIVEERQSVNGKLVEVSRNFYAICEPTNDVVYFGEQVDIFNADGTITHEGAWRAGVNGAVPGIIMPGTFLLGSRYFQEQAPDVAMDRAEHVQAGLALNTEAGEFSKCVRIRGTTPLEPGAEDEKIYCPGVGMVVDGVLELVKFGFDRDRDRR